MKFYISEGAGANLLLPPPRRDTARQIYRTKYHSRVVFIADGQVFEYRIGPMKAIGRQNLIVNVTAASVVQDAIHGIVSQSYMVTSYIITRAFEKYEHDAGKNNFQ